MTDGINDATAIFPVEVWTIITDKLSSPHDLYTCTKVCTFFANLLRWKSRTSAEVLLILLEQKVLDEATTWRLVCRDWKFALDTHWQSLDFHLSVNSDTSRWRWKSTRAAGFIFDSGDTDIGYNLHWFLQDFEGTFEKNSFPFRFCSFADDELMGFDKREYWNRVGNALDKFGTHLWDCDLCNGTQHQEGEAREQLLRCLSLMPNLRLLTLNLYNAHESHFMEEEDRDRLISAPLTLNSFSYAPGSRLRFPDLVKLKLVGVPSPVAWTLLDVCEPSKLKHLVIRPTEAGFDDVSRVVERFPGLEEVTLRNPTPYVNSHPMSSLGEVTSLSLKVLEMRVTLTSFEALFNSLDKLEELIVLKLDLVAEGPSLRFDGNGEQNGLKLNLPRLQELKLKLCERVVVASISFLENLTNLKFCEIRHAPSSKSCEWTSDETWIQHNVVKTNLWEKLPNLEMLHFGGLTAADQLTTINATFRKHDETMTVSSYFPERKNYIYKNGCLKWVASRRLTNYYDFPPRP